MDVPARLTSKGQVTVPKAVRDALGLQAGDAVVFWVEDGHAVITKTPSFLELAGSVPVPPDKREVPWEDVRAATHRALGERMA